MIKQLFAQLLENVSNKIFKLDPVGYRKLQPHTGKVLHLIFTDLSQEMYLVVRENRLYFFSNYTRVPDTVIRGTTFTFLKMLISDVVDNRVFMEGDLEFAQDLQATMRELDIRWEEYLSYFCGDVVTHSLGTFWHQLKNSVQNTTQRTIEDVVDYIQEEKHFLPSREEVEDFYEDVATLRLDIDRLEARWSRLKEE